MEPDISYQVESADQFWDALSDVLSTPCTTPESIDNCLRSFLSLIVTYKAEYLASDDEVSRCVYQLRTAAVFTQQEEYVRRQFVYVLLQEDDPAILHICAALLLLDGRQQDPTFEMIRDEGGFPRLVELIHTFGQNGEHSELFMILLDLIYEQARIFTLEWLELASVDDAFVLSLFSMIESMSGDVADPFHYSIIRVLLVLNEQYMVVSSQPPPPGLPNGSAHLTNRVIKAIGTHSASYKTFGQTIILLINREKEAILQIQILKLLYLVFATSSTAEYFYTNDLHVLLDVVLRNLLDLPADDDDMPSDSAAMTQALRHTYLRVLHNLLENSQLRRPGMGYKGAEILDTLDILSGRRAGGFIHFAPLDETTLRLVDRCRSVEWLHG
ncbi:hypothetical protein BT63DRAFT_460704 [Microthyrium microscopicum]|uniref:SPIN90/Ldb17 leucine-rich domain-containing protein n=1 Tax=Microthyrium microscopicum TaxID=703497 RepID=A0A6A6TZ10_9PEZI|nr:hypothetical protein BT63DRAFT_460704 [Microthyrium microscopicum]